MSDADARERANAWVARFAPLVMQEATAEEEVRRRIATARALRADLPDLSDLTAPTDAELVATVGRAAGQLDSVEDDLRRRLSRLDPDDPDGRPDLDRLNERLQERLARQEIGLKEGEVAVFERKTAPGNLGAAAFMGVFGLGWIAFTTLHCAFMVGGFALAIGWPALFLLLFYAIFFFVGFAMLAGALRMASNESIALEERKLTVRYRFGPRRKETVYELPPDARAEIVDIVADGVTVASPSGSNYRTPMAPAVVLTDVDGKTVGIARGATPTVQTRLRDEINDCLSLT